MNDQNIRFIRKNGRVIPIRTDNPGYERAKRVERTAHHAATAIGSGFAAGGTAYYGLTKQEKKFKGIVSRYDHLIKKALNRKQPLPLPRKPTLFDLHQYNRERKVLKKGTQWAEKLLPERNAALKTAKYISKFKGRAALTIGAVAAIGSIGASLALRDK